MSDVPNSNLEEIRARSEAFETLVQECVDGKLSQLELIDHLRSAGASPSEAQDFVLQAQQRLSVLDQTENNDDQRASTPEGLSGQELEDFRRARAESNESARSQAEEARRNALDAVAWSLLRAKVADTTNTRGHGNAPTSLGFDFSTLLGLSPSLPNTGTIPASVLSAAPHLAKMVSAPSDPHIESTWKLRQAFTTEKALDPIIDILQLQTLC